MKKGKGYIPTEADDIIKDCEDHHIWVNAFSCINPSEEFLADLGRQIVGMLNNPNYSRPKYVKPEDRDIEAMHDFAQLTPIVYLSVNKS